MTLRNCRLCLTGKVEPLLNLGSQPLCNRYLDRPEAEEALFPLALGQCLACGMIQILDPVPAEDLKPRFEWISYREAEGHLDDLVDEICHLPGVTTASLVGGVSFKDDSTVERFQKKGFAAQGPKGEVDILIARHIVEHAPDTAAFVTDLRRRVRPDGILVIEVPDCGPALRRGDYTMPWEEHRLYFTEDLLRQAVACWGLPPLLYRLYPYSHENSLVAILRGIRKAEPRAPDPSIAGAARTRGHDYARGFEGYRLRTREALAQFRNEKGRIALFGAGHLSSAWINFLKIRDLIDFVVDDNPKMAGLLMPGSHLPILTSSQLTRREIKLCISSLNQESEAKVTAKNQDFLSGGGTFASIFPGRPNSFPESIHA